MTRDEELSAILQTNRRLREELKEARGWAIRMKAERDGLRKRLNRLLRIAVRVADVIGLCAPNDPIVDELDKVLERELYGVSKWEWERISRGE